MLFTESDVAEVRHVVQRILVPCIFVVGLLGNSVSIYVLTRKRMRCTTNIYLTALAMTDIIYLTMALLLSLKHYVYVQRHCEIYWKHYGIVVWLCDACAYISIYIAVCFTIERFIAIRYPLKRQTFCTESLAKKVIAGVSLFCLLSTISTAFEHEYAISYKWVNPEGQLCNPDTTTLLEDQSDDMFQGSGGGGIQMEHNSMEPINQRREINLSAANIPNIENSSEFLQLDAEFLPPASNHSAPSTVLPTWQSTNNFAVSRNDSLTATVDYCQNVTYYRNSYSRLAEDELYKSIWPFFTLFVFVLIPLSVLATFNFFLIMLVRRSKSLRGEMTNASSIRRPKRKTTMMSSVSQENRVTVTLIAVVLLFIVCQLPWAIYLILSEQIEIDDNMRAITGNILNFLAAINAAANFFLYCVLSDKYRKTVRKLITGYRFRQQHRIHLNNNTNASIYTTSATALSTNGSRRYRPTIIK